MSNVSQVLREEIGRLKTKVAKLEEALAVIESDGLAHGKKRTMSAEAIAKIRRAKKKWWKERKSRDARIKKAAES